MSDSDSSDDVPLAALKGNKREESSEEEEFDDEESDGDDGEEEAGGDEPDSDDFIVEESDDDDDDGDYASDSSDDAPISSLKSAKKKTPAKKAKTPAKKSSTKKAAPKKKATSAKKKKTTKKAAKSKPTSTSSNNYLSASSELYAASDKGKLIQSLLARWWYAYDWPDPSSLPDATPKGYDALDGFPGVYICTSEENVGKFLDYRDHTQSPNFNNFAKKSSEELQTMLLKAIDAQMRVLIEHEGPGTETEKNLRVLEKWAGKLKCSKADKDAEKVLKAKKLKLS